MMKKIFIAILLILFLSSYSFAAPPALLGCLQTVGGEQPDSCTGGLTFSWHCENTDVTLGTPAGCSAGDETASVGAGSPAINADVTPYDGSYTVDIPASGPHYYSFTLSNDTIVDDTKGTVSFYLYVNAFADASYLFKATYNVDNQIYIKLSNFSTINRIELYHVGNTTIRKVETSNSTDMPTGQWVLVTAKWSTTAVGGNYLYINYNDGSDHSNVLTDSITAFASNATGLWIGKSAVSTAGDYALDKIEIWDSWK